MSSNSDAIADLEASKSALESQCNTASGAVFLKLLTSIQHIADEVGALVALNLSDSPYLPQTTAFSAETADAKAFVATLGTLKTAFSAVSGFAAAIDKIISFVK